MANHKKPTAEELEANIKKAAEEIESSKETNEEQQTEDTNKEASDDNKEAEENQQGDKDEAQDEKDTQEVGENEEVDYKKKFVHSTRESQVLHSKNKKINEVVEKAITMPDPTDEELQKEFSDWDVMSDTEKKLAKKTYKYDKAFALLNEVTRESKDAEVWNGKIDSFIDDPKTLNSHPDLEGKEDDFRLFASKPTRRGVDFDDLVKAFLFDVSSTRQKNKGKMFETGAGGQDNKPKTKSDMLTALEGRRLMKTDYKKWKDMLIAGKIANE